jgi:short-subunit dehydrogenase
VGLCRFLFARRGEPHLTSSADPAQAEASARRPAVVVTGASEGIGFSIAHRFAAAGHTVLLIARRAEPLAAAAAGVAGRNGGRAFALPLDITVCDAAARIDGELERLGLYADIVVNNAGVGLGGPFADHDSDKIAALIDLNVRALTLLTRHYLPAMAARGGGSIINIASLGGFTPGPWQASYYASKAYVVSLSRALSAEARGTGVRICVVTPGPVDTAFHARMGADTAPYRYLMPSMSAEAVARATYRGWRLGFRVIQPGLLTPILSMAMRVTPWFILVPIVGLLLGARYTRKGGR